MTSEGLRQTQFLTVLTRDEAEQRFRAHLTLAPLGSQTVSLDEALGRVLAEDLVAPIDVPGFDRSNVDGFALIASDTHGAMEEAPRTVRLNSESLSPGIRPTRTVVPGTATSIATGGMLPRGADAVVMIEQTDLVESSSEGPLLEISRAVAAGENVTFAGTDIARGETLLRSGQLLTAREIGVLAAMGIDRVSVVRRPRVAILSTGNELAAPGASLNPGCIYDSNQAVLTAAVREIGGDPVPLGIVPDDEGKLTAALQEALSCDVVLLSGGTSKGDGDLSYRVVGRLDAPGVVAHGVALKPGKPICLAVHHGKPVVILPGFPTSAIFTFHEFVAPVIQAMAGLSPESREVVTATLPMRIHSERGRTEYVLVGLAAGGKTAYPMGKGSGSVTAFSQADGFLTIPQHTEQLEAGSRVQMHLLSRSLRPADLIVIGSHCVGLDWLLGELRRRGYTSKTINVGSTAGLAAVKRGECDLAGIHLMDAATGQYNHPFVTEEIELIPGYGRMQAFVFRKGDARFLGKSADEAVQAALADTECRMVNRNAGSGTRIVIDQLLNGRHPPGYGIQARSHNAVAAAIAQERADWGVAIDTVARMYGLSALPVREERYDFLIARRLKDRPAVQAFMQLLQDAAVRMHLRELGFLV